MNNLHTAEDIVAETVMRAWQHFGRTATWFVVWKWAERTAKNLVADARRSTQRARIDPRRELEVVPAASEANDAPTSLAAVLDHLRGVLGEPEQQTLQLLVAGVHDNEAIAALRGRRLRAVQESRRKIREAATQAWNICRALHPRTSLVM